MSRSEIEELAASAGPCVTSSVSAKTALVVAADPHPQSGKARQARDRGVRMVTEQVFLHMLDQMQPSKGFPGCHDSASMSGDGLIGASLRPYRGCLVGGVTA